MLGIDGGAAGGGAAAISNAANGNVIQALTNIFLPELLAAFIEQAAMTGS
jgi:hypothetical protein